MKISQFYPVIMTSEVAQTSAFYKGHFDMVPLFESDWYVHLQSAQDDRINLAVLDRSHKSIPLQNRDQQASGLLLNFEVDDVDAVYAKSLAEGMPMLLPLRSEPWGQRHFITQDPNGVMIDVIMPIPPSEEFATQYTDQTSAFSG
ncbi:VOC family protein [Pusillimonas sp. NJUB218]|uniref:VOC family protein n=1 Tax=Pusillimonas sp. NJUB218 TaxID=2023230 RepID=UPI000F4CD37D|nr:VOC family protein [Pusillimonas sp. NJUB218]ROT44423.1 glyoxalase [Pusillimonas sp. NJUB218]